MFGGVLTRRTLKRFLSRLGFIAARFHLKPSYKPWLSGKLPLHTRLPRIRIRILVHRSYEPWLGSCLPTRVGVVTYVDAVGSDEGICAHGTDAVPRRLRRCLHRNVRPQINWCRHQVRAKGCLGRRTLFRGVMWSTVINISCVELKGWMWRKRGVLDVNCSYRNVESFNSYC